MRCEFIVRADLIKTAGSRGSASREILTSALGRILEEADPVVMSSGESQYEVTDWEVEPYTAPRSARSGEHERDLLRTAHSVVASSPSAASDLALADLARLLGDHLRGEAVVVKPEPVALAAVAAIASAAFERWYRTDAKTAEQATADAMAFFEAMEGLGRVLHER